MDSLAKEVNLSPAELRQRFGLQETLRAVIIINKRQTDHWNRALMEEVFHVLEGDKANDKEFIKTDGMKDALEIVNDFLRLMFYSKEEIGEFTSDYTTWLPEEKILLLNMYRDRPQRNPNRQLREIIESLQADIRDHKMVSFRGQQRSIRSLFGPEDLPVEKYLKILLKHEHFSHHKPLFKSIAKGESTNRAALTTRSNRDSVGIVDFTSAKIKKRKLDLAMITEHKNGWVTTAGLNSEEKKAAVFEKVYSTFWADEPDTTPTLIARTYEVDPVTKKLKSELIAYVENGKVLGFLEYTVDESLKNIRTLWFFKVLNG